MSTNGSNKRYFWLYFWPDSAGTPNKVWKLRFSFPFIFLVFGLLLTFSCGFLYIVGDYTRLQVSKLHKSYQLNVATKENKELRVQKKNLKTKLSKISVGEAEERDLYRSLSNKLSKIESIVEKAEELGLIEGEAGSSAGVGGPEKDESELCDAQTKYALNSVGKDCQLEKVSFFSGRRKKVVRQVDFLRQETDNLNVLNNRLDYLVDRIEELPMSLPGNARVSSNYGYRRSPFTRKVRMHHGLDLSLPYGSKIRATGVGFVKSVSRHPAYGLVIDISHNDRLVTRYAHLSKALVTEGQYVSLGDVIGKVGSSGLSTGPHLHYEVRVNGKSIDPRSVISLGRKLERVVNNA